ncbi:MAG: HAD-IA family hydrolase [Leptolyngbyaceae cyanobacterium]
MLKPKVIFLDAVGTLFGVKESVGSAYATVASRFGVTADAEALNQAFFEQFKAADPMAFPDADPTDIPALEYAWWRAIAEQSFQAVEALDPFSDFDAFFAALYAYFASAEPWVIYPDTYDALERWKSRGIQLGVISNFDSRIYTVLEVLTLADCFQSITISTEVGVAKPDSLIFATALQKHHCNAFEAWHVGDSYRDDYEGARAAVLRGVWLRRSQQG